MSNKNRGNMATPVKMIVTEDYVAVSGTVYNKGDVVVQGNMPESATLTDVNEMIIQDKVKVTNQ